MKLKNSASLTPLSSLTKILSEISFTKMHGAGNDFVLIDDSSFNFPIDDKSIIRRLCHRQLGVGSDGCILVQPSKVANLRMRFFNPDGSEGKMCGNGLRCLILFSGREKCSVETASGIRFGGREKGDIWTDLGKGEIKRDGEYVRVNIGNDHLIFFPSEENFYTQAIDLMRTHNVNVSGVWMKEKLIVRTVEKGVGDETLACGTGIAASHLAAHFLGKAPSEHTIESHSGALFYSKISASNVTLRGPARTIFSGKIKL